MALQFREGTALDSPVAVAVAASRAGLDGEEALARTSTDAVKLGLRRHTDEALVLGVTGVPTVVCPDGLIFWGDDQLESAAKHITSSERGATG